MKNHYEILGVDKTADEAVIKQAYRKLAMKFHPDKNKGDADSEDRFKEISEANEVLSDKDKRAAYDTSLNSPFGGSSADDTMMNDFMNMFRQNANAFERGSDIVVTFPVNLDEVLNGAVFSRTVTRKLSNGTTQSYQPNIEIPTGVNHGEKFVKGRGGHYSQGHGGVAGGLVIIIAIRPHDTFIREGADLIYKHQINYHEFIEGTDIMVPLLGGSKAKVKVSAGTKSDAILSLKGKGLPFRHNSTQRGNILVHLSVYIPISIDDDEQELLESIKKSKSFVYV
jgi:DnaJ-class molecular chaperone|tara:strand:+ start:2484 stop:3329 length:846 start_codon:yes stop_codon:yes gene_type:complete